MLLSDPEVVQFLKSKVVSSWEMVREAPKVTIDFGGDKKLTRTLAGNTVMYLCTEDGKVLDAFPGVYTPKDFLKEIRESIDRTEDRKSVSQWPAERGAASPIPQRAIMTTMSKARVESPILAALKTNDREDLVSTRKSLVPFEQYAAMLKDLSKSPNPEGLGEGASPLAIIEADSRTNVRAVRPAVHLWLASLPSLPTTDAAKDVMFKKVLHIPIDDPYLGLGVTLPGTKN